MHLRIAIVDGGSSGMVMATVSSSTSPWCASPRFVNHIIPDAAPHRRARTP